MRSTLITLAAAAVAFAVAGPGRADDQLAANAGLAPAAAAGLSLTEIAQAKFNRDSENRQAVVERRAATAEGRAALAANAGIAPADAGALSLTEIAAVKFSREAEDAAQNPAVRGSVTKAARSVAAPVDRTQLVASAGLSPAEATGLSLTAIAAAKFDRDTD